MLLLTSSTVHDFNKRKLEKSWHEVANWPKSSGLGEIKARYMCAHFFLYPKSHDQKKFEICVIF
jgi:hypothetical protein